MTKVHCLRLSMLHLPPKVWRDQRWRRRQRQTTMMVMLVWARRQEPSVSETRTEAWTALLGREGDGWYPYQWYAGRHIGVHGLLLRGHSLTVGLGCIILHC